jgi:voltage-gated potassium channel
VPDQRRDGGRFRIQPSDGPGSGRLRFSSNRFGPVANIALRLGIAVAALLITALTVYLERGCYADRGLTGTLTPLDAIYYATVSLSTTGYGDIVPVCESSRLANVLIITPLRFLFLIVLVGTTVEVLTRRTREEFRSSRWRKNVQDHTVIIGFGVKGRSAARTIVDSGVEPKSIVIVSEDREAIDEATRLGYVGVIGDARREEVLKDAVIERSSRVIIAVNEDDTTVLCTLTARRLAPTATIVVSARESVNAEILRQSGANTVIPTAESAGHLMGMSLIAPTAGELMEDLLDSAHGLDVTERDVLPGEIGRRPSDLEVSGQLVLAIIRGGTVLRFDEDGADTLQAGDRLVVIRSQNRRTFDR